jgi:hypothetical protein
VLCFYVNELVIGINKSMNKFLKLIEQSLPDENKQLQYTVLEKIVGMFNKAFKGAQGLSISAGYPDKLIIDIQGDKLVFTLSDMIDSNGDGEVVPEEENQELVNSKLIDREVSKLAGTASTGLKGLAAKAVGTLPQKAKTAQDKRVKQVMPGMIKAYEEETADIASSIAKLRADRQKRQQGNII